MKPIEEREEATYHHRKRQRAGYTMMRITYDAVMALLILGIGFVMFFGTKIEMVASTDPIIRYVFGSLCFLYGGFRAWRAFRANY